MIELKNGARTIDLPYSIRLYGVTEEMFDELVDEDTKAELLDGVMIVHSPASLRHDYIGGFVRGLMSDFADEMDRGDVLGPESLIRIAKGRRFAPDAYFLKKGRLAMPLRKKLFVGIPNLALEVLSPRTDGTT